MRGGRIKILHVVFSLEPGGLENGVVNVARHLDPAEFEVHVCCLERRGAFADRLPNPSCVTVLEKPPGWSPRTLLRLARLLRREQFTVMHTHNLGPLIYGCGARMTAGVFPALLHGEHGMLTRPESTRFYRWLRGWLHGRCQGVHTVSHALVDHFAAEGFRRDRLVAVVNGVDAERFSPGDRRAARERLGWTPEMLVLGMVGTMQRRKRHDDVLTAFEQLAATTPDLRLLIVGEGGSETTAVRARVQASRWRERIHLAGFQPEPQAYYPAIDLLLVPSTNEGLSNATLEAMACEVPVLTHTACGNADIIKPGVDGFVVELAGAADLARCLAEVVARREQLPQMGRLARAKVVQTFSLRQMAAEYAKLYHKLAGQGKKA